jgi:hypothetical protein
MLPLIFNKKQGMGMAEAGKPWGVEEKEAWWQRQTIKRSYEHDVLDRLKALPSDQFRLEQYGALSTDPARYPLFRVFTEPQNKDNPTVVITGGVHGYEPSGVIAALRFLEEMAPQFKDRVNFVVYPCVSPIGYEVDHRWNRFAEDPNRHFIAGGTAEESVKVMESIKSLQQHFRAAADLHETNNRDLELTAERRARDGQPVEPGDDYIPEGYYLYITASGADEKLGPEIIEAVRKVTPITKDTDIFGDPCDNGIITVNSIPSACQSFMGQYADIAMTTEIYPDKCSQREAEDAQLASIRQTIDFVLRPQ